MAGASDEERLASADIAGPGRGHPSAKGGFEPLACVSCRSRKLKCDRTKPACTRCSRLQSECVYPESRRKPAFKRRNVRELEERLAQVEVLLKDAAAGKASPERDPSGGPHQEPSILNPTNAVENDGAGDGFDWDAMGQVPTSAEAAHPPPQLDKGPSVLFGFPLPQSHQKPRPQSDEPSSFEHSPCESSRHQSSGTTTYELLGLGMFESLPPSDMIEDLHQQFFVNQHPLIPIIHPGRYMHAFYSAPHLRPPMALMYAIWTMAANGHEKYATYHDAFYRRARNYLEEDELRGEGEYFLTIAHAQAWIILATDEARCMWFTRAAMSSARAIKLINMMGLHRLDDQNASFEMLPTIAPPKDWTELEERRRVFWGAFCIDSHASISTGWPSLIDMRDVTTHLPCSEEAFYLSQEEATSRLEEVFSGSNYSTFAGAAVICYIFNRILRHVHQSKPEDHPENYEYGSYWNRHRELDNMLSSTFMFLPDLFRLPKHVRNPVAVHTNLNLHAAVMCLHNSACEMAKEHNLPHHVKQVSQARVSMAAQEVVNIVKLTSHLNTGYRSPLVALSLYVASSVYIVQAQEQGLQPTGTANLEFLLAAMEAIGKQHRITMSFLRQAILDLERAGFLELVRIPKVDMPTEPDVRLAACGNNIPLFARSKVSRHTDILPPLPGRLPLGNPIGKGYLENQIKAIQSGLHSNSQSAHLESDGVGNGNKRRRVDSSELPARQNSNPAFWFQPDDITAREVSDTTSPGSGQGRATVESTRQQPGGVDISCGNGQFELSHRGGSSSDASSPSGNNRTTPSTQAAGSSNSNSNSSAATPGMSTGSGILNSTTTTPNCPVVAGMSAPLAANPNPMAHQSLYDLTGAGAAATAGMGMNFEGLASWDMTGDITADSLYAPVSDALRNNSADTLLGNDPWTMLNGSGVDGSWDAGGGPG